jgi:hypothetical protein
MQQCREEHPGDVEDEEVFYAAGSTPSRSSRTRIRWKTSTRTVQCGTICDRDHLHRRVVAIYMFVSLELVAIYFQCIYNIF